MWRNVQKNYHTRTRCTFNMCRYFLIYANLNDNLLCDYRIDLRWLFCQHVYALESFDLKISSNLFDIFQRPCLVHLIQLKVKMENNNMLILQICSFRNPTQIYMILRIICQTLQPSPTFVISKFCNFCQIFNRMSI